MVLRDTQLALVRVGQIHDEVHDFFKPTRTRVQSFPPEILAEIFAHATSNFSEDPFAIFALSHVCSLWRSMVNDFPTLHQRFRLAHPEQIKAHLHRSLDLPLEITMIGHGQVVDQLAETKKLLAPHVSRIRSFTLITHAGLLCERMLRQFEKMGSGNLRHLTLQCRDAVNTQMEYALLDAPRFRETLGNLTSLTLFDVKTPNAGLGHGGPGFLFKVTHVELHYTFVSPPSSEHLIQFVARCPRLRHLTLHSLLEFEVTTPVYVCEPCEPDQLRTITLDTPGYEGIVHFLRCLAPVPNPELTTKIASITEESTVRQFFQRPAEHPLLQLDWPRGLKQLFIHAIDRESIVIFGSYSTDINAPMSTANPPPFQLCIGLTHLDDAPSERSLWSLPIEDTSAVQLLVVDPYFEIGTPQTREQWACLLGRLPALTKLVISQPEDYEVCELMWALIPRSETGEQHVQDHREDVDVRMDTEDGDGDADEHMRTEHADADSEDKRAHDGADEGEAQQPSAELVALCPNLKCIEFTGMPDFNNTQLHHLVLVTCLTRILAGCPSLTFER
ncbi:hypothetical protein C2E23DRAFT_288024 [Lenzites betulinus]|nr:hypothetical protein C2E23DRAFT_288024 [Lenzites betulinus]